MNQKSQKDFDFRLKVFIHLFFDWRDFLIGVIGDRIIGFRIIGNRIIGFRIIGNRIIGNRIKNQR